MKLDRKCRISGFEHHLPRQGSSPEIPIQEVWGANQESIFNRIGTTMQRGLQSQRYTTSELGANFLLIISLSPLRASLEGETGRAKEGEGAVLGVGSLQGSPGMLRGGHEGGEHRGDGDVGITLNAFLTPESARYDGDRCLPQTYCQPNYLTLSASFSHSLHILLIENKQKSEGLLRVPDLGQDAQIKHQSCHSRHMWFPQVSRETTSNSKPYTRVAAKT